MDVLCEIVDLGVSKRGFSMFELYLLDREKYN